MRHLYIFTITWYITSYLLILAPQSYAFSQLSQDSIKISINVKDAPLETVFKQIEKQTGLTIYYAKKAVDGNQQVSINLFKVSLSEAMHTILKNKKINWKLGKNSIILSQTDETKSLIKSEKPELNSDSIPLITVIGKITDSNGNPLKGATVLVKESGQGTSADSLGQFHLPKISRNSSLIFRSVGFETKQLKAITEKPLHIVLNLSIKDIQQVEILSTGYQDISRQRATGSYVQLDNKILNRKVSTNIFDRITEITSGLNFNPNKNVNSLQIRGVSTLTANNLPLLVVDGFAYDNTNNSSLQLVYEYLNNVNPNDVESITVLKDAAAASIWGARSGNGVIVINTKTGKYNQKPKVQFVTNINMGEKPRLNDMHLLSSAETVQFEESLFLRDYYRDVEDAGTNFNIYNTLIPPVYELLIAKRNGTISDATANLMIEEYRKNDVRDDLREHFLQTSINQQYAINFSGGSNNHSYYASVGYDKNRSENIGNIGDRLTLRVNNTFRPIRKLELSILSGFTQTNNKKNGIPYQNFFGATRPVYNKLVDAQGEALPLAHMLRTSFASNPGNPDYLDWQYRPLEEIRNNDNKTVQTNIRISGSAKYSFIEGLNAEIKTLYEKGFTNEKSLHNLQSFTARNLINQFLYRDASDILQFPVPLNSILDTRNTELQSWSIRGQLTFARQFAEHEINILAGIEVRETQNDLSITRKYGYDPAIGTFNLRPDFTTRYLTNPARISSIQIPVQDNMIGTLNRFRSYYTNAAYTYRGKYTVSTSLRQDGTNLFGVKTKDRVVPLWSTGLLWDISEEPFYALQWLPKMKLRASYGFNGNMRNDATTYPVIQYAPRPSPNAINDLIYASILSPSNPSLRWEKVQILNLGFDFESKNSRISGTVEFYTKNGIDLINEIDLDPTAYKNGSGSSTFIGNGASIKGRGIDITINTLNVKSKELYWVTTFLFSHNREVVSSLGDARLSSSKAGSSYAFEGAAILVGKPVYALYSFPWAGLDPTNGDPLGYVNGTVVPYTTVLASSGGDFNTKPENMIYHGQTNPKFWGTLRNTFSIGEFSFSANILFKFGHYFRKPTIDYSGLYSNINGHSDYSFRWQKPGDEKITYVPSLPMAPDANRDQFYMHSEILTRKADHIRLQDVRIDYSLNKSSVKKMPFESLSFYIYINNIGKIWTANKEGLDPEWEFSHTSTKPPRTLAIGMTINL